MEKARTNLIETGDNRGYILFPMEMGAKIKQARERRGWSQADLGRRVGISQVAIKKIESGETLKSKYLAHVAAELGLDLLDLDPSLAPGQPTGELHPAIPREKLFSSGSALPVYSAAEGGPGEIIVTVDAVDFIARPAPLANVRDAYGLLIVGTSMEPEFRPGETALIDPHLPLVGGETCIFYAESCGVARATIKHLRRATDDKWFVSQWNPPRDFAIPRAEWRWAHRVLGKYSRR